MQSLKIKSLIIVLLCIALLSLASCSNAAEDSAQDQPQTVEDDGKSDQTLTLEFVFPSSAGIENFTVECSFAKEEYLIDIMLAAGEEQGFTVKTEGDGKEQRIIAIEDVANHNDAFGGDGIWVYRVNGQVPDRSATTYQPSNGDVILWQYLVDAVE